MNAAIITAASRTANNSSAETSPTIKPLRELLRARQTVAAATTMVRRRMIIINNPGRIGDAVARPSNNVAGDEWRGFRGWRIRGASYPIKDHPLPVANYIVLVKLSRLNADEKYAYACITLLSSLSSFLSLSLSLPPPTDTLEISSEKSSALAVRDRANTGVAGEYERENPKGTCPAPFPRSSCPRLYTLARISYVN